MPVDDHDLDGSYTTAEAAEKLKVSIPTVKRMIRDGELETYRVRGRVFIPHRAVLVYVNSTRNPAPKGKR